MRLAYNGRDLALADAASKPYDALIQTGSANNNNNSSCDDRQSSSPSSTCRQESMLLCRLDRFKALSAAYIPTNYEEECKVSNQ